MAINATHVQTVLKAGVLDHQTTKPTYKEGISMRKDKVDKMVNRVLYGDGDNAPKLEMLEQRVTTNPRMDAVTFAEEMPYSFRLRRGFEMMQDDTD